MPSSELAGTAGSGLAAADAHRQDGRAHRRNACRRARRCQKQLDVLGEVLECAWVLRDQLDELAPPTPAFLRSLADRAAATWREPDAGIWEGREGERDYLTSKVMCWVDLDRAIHLADRLGEEADVTHWRSAREEVRTAILDRGWNEQVQAFTGAFDSKHLDAGVLLLPIVGFLAGDDERVVATLDAIERHLTQDALVQRWTGSGDEGAFIICSYWLAAARAMAVRGSGRSRSSRPSRATPTMSGSCRRRSTTRQDLDRQLPAGAVPHRPGQRRLGYCSS